ncbi:hypothetical protein QJS10_CPB12g01057 [Acorus calamus]|uniref:Uncharacterized protein n=1 Tax=Acorus calamus TaxID=4465 RepID=A0AAV9DMQ4_ACOCL|nr:hypothetical protein QJS10_CPB12g01057 [Acorus calamus]
MAQLPPKVPTNWPSFTPPPPPTTHHHPSWVDEFLDFSAAKRVSHRRSASDSVAFHEPPHFPNHNQHDEFDRLDEEQLMSMFSDDTPSLPPVSATSTPRRPRTTTESTTRTRRQRHRSSSIQRGSRDGGVGVVAAGGYLDQQRVVLNVDNSALKQHIAALAQDKIFKDG